MKTTLLVFSIIAVTVLGACAQNTDTKALLENPESRNEIMSTIAGNHHYMTQFMVAMQQSDHAMQMMQGNEKIRGHMMKDGGMQMIMKDSTMMMNMMQGMMKDGKMMGNMMKMMHEKGMMSEDCVESCKKMIEENELKTIEQGELELSKSQSHGDHH
ncbi:hypothetical protein [Flagellimonas pacifica]|uniref:DUF4175 domain-containing protein n=1 Tax=Flagellimonas pacifica TaxID=1247520 RepID=A0A285MVZ9_9FLAO|nr:hypothetical protein [Allomuricauda parva]SNZ01365.1 hypothetical protein SAMN06265377_3203 [Allomuricauda parva]